jgi:hypothetical protein
MRPQCGPTAPRHKGRVWRSSGCKRGGETRATTGEEPGLLLGKLGLWANHPLGPRLARRFGVKVSPGRPQSGQGSPAPSMCAAQYGGSRPCVLLGSAGAIAAHRPNRSNLPGCCVPATTLLRSPGSSEARAGVLAHHRLRSGQKKSRTGPALFTKFHRRARSGTLGCVFRRLVPAVLVAIMRAVELPPKTWTAAGLRF